MNVKLTATQTKILDFELPENPCQYWGFAGMKKPGHVPGFDVLVG